MPIVFSWIAAAFAAALLAWIIGKVTLGLRSDYLAIATLGISEIVIAVLKHEDWLSRGVKNVTGLPRPVPYEIRLQESEWFIDIIEWLNSSRLSVIETVSGKQDLLNKLVIEGSSIYVKLCYAGLFISVLVILFFLSQLALNSPWGRMLRAIRDNEVAASAMGKNIVGQHLQVFILGSAIIGIAGAMLTTLDGQFTPGTYQPLRFTFIIWVMVIVGGSGNNLGSIFGGFFIWFMWIEAEPISIAFISLVTSGMDYGDPIRTHLIASAPHMRLFIMGAILLITLRFMPRGVIPEKVVRPS
jgi:branched-chain amino acid transport system permease protein